WIDTFLSVVPGGIILAFHGKSAILQSMPYRYWQTRAILRLSSPAPVSLKGPIEAQMRRIICDQMPRLNSTRGMETTWVFESVAEVLALWAATNTECISSTIIFLLNNFEDKNCLGRILQEDKEAVELHLWGCFPRTILDMSSGSDENTFTALWQFIASIGLQEHIFSDSRLPLIEAVLQTLPRSETSFERITQSVISLLQVLVLRDSNLPFKTPEMWYSFSPGRFSPTRNMGELLMPMLDEKQMSVAQWSDVQNLGFHRLSEPCLVILTDYLEHCTAEDLPYKAADTCNKIVNAVYLTPAVAINPTLQVRLADSVHSIFASGTKMELLNAIVTCPLWAVYAAGVKTEEEVKARRAQFRFSTGDDPADDQFPLDPRERFWPWLDDLEARRRIKDNLAFANDSPRETLTLLRRILQGLDCWHPENAVTDEEED
ncbi:hypothetical protein DFH06DRAFT_1242421, partial [Mycena polygramma]